MQKAAEICERIRIEKPVVYIEIPGAISKNRKTQKVFLQPCTQN